MAPGTVHPNIFSWNRRLARLVQGGQHKEALELSYQIQKLKMNPDKFTFIPVLNACAALQTLEEGRRVHTQIIQSGCEPDVYVSNSLLDMYTKCGSIDDAVRVFNKMPIHSVVSWNIIILGSVKCGRGQMALQLYRQMQQEEVEPNSASFMGVLSACGTLATLEEGKWVHEQIIQKGYHSNMLVSSSLVDMYAKCGCIEDASDIFNQMPSRDVVAWNAMILGHVKCGQAGKALKLSQQMEQEGFGLNPVTFVGVLNACASIGALDQGRYFHKRIIERGFESDIFVGNSLIDMYAKCGTMEDAMGVFNAMTSHDVISWNALILGHVRCGQGLKALELSRQMQHGGVRPDSVSFVGMLNACASVGALMQGREIHKQIIQVGCESNTFIGNSLIDMYAKCGSIEDAKKVFIVMPTRNVFAWTAMLRGYAMHGQATQALQHFERMCQGCEDMNTVTFVSLLSACSHAGLIDEGMHYFESMDKVYGISAMVEHYSCMVDLLGRGGRLHEAENLIGMISCEPNVSVWMSLLGACRVHGNMEMADGAVKQIMKLDPG